MSACRLTICEVIFRIETCPKSGLAHSLCRSMVTPLERIRASKILSASVVLSCSSGFSPRVHGSRCRARKVVRLELMTNGRDEQWRTSVHGFLDATCSDLCVAPGQMTHGKDGGGEEPPYHVPTFVLTHHPRNSLEMKGGTTFHFVTDGIHAALQRAKDAAKDKDVRIGGGVSTIRQYLRERLIDELHLAFRPVLMGSGENLFSGIDLTAFGYTCTEHVSTDHAMHVVLRKQA